MTEQFAYTQKKLFIGGEWVSLIDSELVPSTNPATGAPWALTAFGGVKGIDRAVAAANEAMRGPWRTMAPSQRAALFLCSDDAKMISGVLLPVDGGLVIA